MLDTTHFPKAKKYWLMGKLYPWSERSLHPMVHALHYGTSVFEGIRAYGTSSGPKIFRLPEHVERFFVSADVVKMKVPYTPEEVTAAIKETVRENEMESCYIRPLFYYAYGNLGLIPKASPVELVIAAWEWGSYMGETAVNGIRVYLGPWRRTHHSQVDMRAKLGGAYVQSTISGLEARAIGADEALFLNIEGRIAEGPGENLFVVKNGVIRTNALSESILEGITRTSILEIARDLGIKTEIGPISTGDLTGADEAFFTGTAVEVIPIIRLIDGSDRNAPRRETVIGQGKPGPVSLRLRQAYLDIVRGNNPKYAKWLSPLD
ncbi:MAG TPA: branched-chain amino acid transaminase [Candidatus Aminicenantes bacterium]|nr:branched-chain amino acid transaminase [Candidatus Aminicenantes bacterium]